MGCCCLTGTGPNFAGFHTEGPRSSQHAGQILQRLVSAPCAQTLADGMPSEAGATAELDLATDGDTKNGRTTVPEDLEETLISNEAHVVHLEGATTRCKQFIGPVRCPCSFIPPTY